MATIPEDTSGVQPYLIIFTPKLLRVLAFVSLALAALLFAVGLFFPRYFEIDIARFILCLAIATTLSIFFFIFYPQAVELSLTDKIGVPMRVVGPIALWFVVLIFLWQWMPSAPTGRVFKPTKYGEPGGMMYDPRGTKIWAEGTEIDYQLIPNKNDKKLFGIYIEFDRNVRSYKAKLKHDPYSPIDVTFSRDGEATFPIDDFKSKESP